MARPNIRNHHLSQLLLDNPLNSYWWGLILSDGHITERGILKVKLQRSDKDYLDGFAEYLGCTTRWEQGMIVIETMDKVNARALQGKLGLKKRKTYNPPDDTLFLSSGETLMAFLIGFIDGDGSITYRNGRFQSIRIETHGSWLPFFQELSERLLVELGLTSTVTLTTRGSCSTYLGKQSTYLTLKQFIEEFQLPTLERKWNGQ